ncbi:Aldo/keto reductase, partial [Wallemia mellicola CBS 633.66]
IPSLIAGCGPLGRNYTSSSVYESKEPVEAVKVALDNGVRAFDNAPHYAPAENVLGRALKILEPYYKRSDYKLITKVGHYGDEVNYTEERIHESLERSFKYLQTDYFDIVYLHDVEFIADSIADINEEGQPTRVAGKIRAIGISALPLPTLLRVSRLALSHLGPDSLQYVMSYANHGPQALAPPSYTQTNFEAFENLFDKNIKLVTASPFSMGLLTPQGPPDWHPAPDGL